MFLNLPLIKRTRVSLRDNLPKSAMLVENATPVPGAMSNASLQVLYPFIKVKKYVKVEACPRQLFGKSLYGSESLPFSSSSQINSAASQ